jgi:hypothetical protein
VDYIKQQLDQGQGMASPWLVLDIPIEWEKGRYNKSARVIGHEGRNRMYAVLETEGDAPVETHLFFVGGLRARHIKPEWIEALNLRLVPQRANTSVSGPFFELLLKTQKSLSEENENKRDTYRVTWRGRLGEYDPNYFDIKSDPLEDDDGKVIAVKDQLVPKSHLRANLNITPNPNLVYRGMSNHEFQNIKKTGVIQSKGEYNLAGQQGLTYFSTEPRSAETYAHSFAPWNQKANWDNPAWVIAVPKPDESKIVHVQGTGSHEVGVKGSIPANQIREIYRGKVVEYDPGVHNQVAPSAWLHWEKMPVDTLLTERKGAPGTLKSKITRLYGGGVTCDKTQKLKTRQGATTLDKRQANWFQNKHCGGATRVDEIISGEHIPGDWKKYGSGDAEMFETEFDLQGYKITISVSRDWAQSGAYVLMKKNIEAGANLVGREIIFRVDGETDPTGLLGTGAANVISIVVGKIIGLLQNIEWDYLVFAGAGDSRQRVYTKILSQISPGLDSEPMQFGDWFLLIKNHLLAAKSQELDEVFKGKPLPGDWQSIKGGSTHYTEFEFAGSEVQIAVVKDASYELQTILQKQVPENWVGYEVSFSVDHSISVTGMFDQKSAQLFDLIIRKLKWFFQTHSWDYINFSGDERSRNKLYLRLAKQLAPADSTVLHTNKSFAIVKQDKLASFTNLDESLSYKGLRPGANIWYEPGMQYSQYNLYPGKSIVGQRVYHMTNKLTSIIKSGGLKPKYDETGAREFGRYSTVEYPFTPVIAIFFDVGEHDWFGKYILSWEITPEDKTARAYMPVDTMQPSDRDNLLPNCQVTPVSIDRITITDLKGNLIKV